MVNETKIELDGLLNEVFQLKMEWDCFQQLFMHSNVRSSLLFEYLPEFMAALMVSLFYNVVTTLCRLTDSESQKTSTLQTMADKLPEARQKMAELLVKCTKIRRFRNKLVAHLDKKVAQGSAELSVPELGELKGAVELAEDVVVQIGSVIDKAYHSLSNASVEHNIDWLHACLAYGSQHEQEVAETKSQILRDHVRLKMEMKID